MSGGSGVEVGVLKIEFATDNAAFVDGGVDEVASVLRQVVELVEGGYMSGALKDANGNAIGQWSLELPEVEETLETV